MKICAMVDRSAGNESVGEMWTETAVFDDQATLDDVLRWAEIIVEPSPHTDYNDIRCNVKLAILQEPKP